MSDELKRQAALAALDWVENGMKLGLGTGSTAEAFVHELAARVRSGLDVTCVTTSERTEKLAHAEGIRLATLDDLPELDLTLDGADEIGPDLVLTKGGGGALLREKIVAAASNRMLVMADGSKRVAALGKFPLPIEVVPFGLAATRLKIGAASRALGLDGRIDLRRAADGDPFVTDGGHNILDASFGRIADPAALADALDGVPGVVEHGLFLGLATAAVIATAGGVEWVTR